MASYTTPSDPTALDPIALADHLRDVMATAAARFDAISAEAAAVSPAPGKWSVQQIVGHLCDSAMNNQQRIVRLALEPSIDLPGYEQEGWVRVQRYEVRGWSEVVGLWLVLNRHFAHTVEGLDRTMLTHVWHYKGEALTLGFIIEDYIAHMKHHLRTLPA